MATIKDVARLAGVSPSTVSKYINGGSVRRENLASIRSAIAQLDYRVDPIARSLKTRRSHSIGILLPSLAAPFFSSVFLASDKVLREHGYHSLMSCYYADHGLERDYLEIEAISAYGGQRPAGGDRGADRRLRPDFAGPDAPGH